MTPAPWFEDFSVGDEFDDVPSVTIHPGYTALHQSVFGDRSRLCLDQPLCQAVTGQNRLLVNPALVSNIAIGQSTIPSQRVLGNLFYRGLRFRRPVFTGDTLTTSTRVVGLRQNSVKPGRAASGMVALEIGVTNQTQETVLHFWRCPMIPCRDPDADTGHRDDFSVMPEAISDADIIGSLPDWNLAPLQARQRDYQPGLSFDIEPRDTVTSAPELVRLTLNMAMTHTDATRSVYRRRLVYGGHGIGIAAAQLSRAMPDLACILAWYQCDHVAPVFEQDILGSRVTIHELQPTARGRLAKLGIEVFAERADDARVDENQVNNNADNTRHDPLATPGEKVLDWQLAALLG